MKLAAFPMVSRSIAERDRLLNLRAQVEADQLHVLIRGTYQDDAMTALVRPIIIGEINGRIRALDRDLESMGVSLA